MPVKKDKFSVDDKGNEAIFYDSDGDMVALLNREAGPSPCNQYAWECYSPDCEEWAMRNGYDAEIMLAKATEMLDEASRKKLYEVKKC